MTGCANVTGCADFAGCKESCIPMVTDSLVTKLQAVQLASRARQAQEEAQRSSGQAEADAANAPKPMRRLWDDVYTISYSRSAVDLQAGLSYGR